MSQLTISDQLEIWSSIISVAEVGRLITSPFRADSEPKCFLREYRGIILFTDWAFPKYNKFTCVHAYAHVKNIKLSEAASILYSKRFFKKNYDVVPKKITVGSKIKIGQSNSHIHFIPHTHEGKSAWTKTDKEYWTKRYTSSHELEEANIFSVYAFYVGNTYIKPKIYPCYALVLNGKIKIYQPYNKEYKWISNTSAEDIWKFERNSNVCLITSSLKDSLHWKRYTDYDIHAYQSEHIKPKDKDYTKYDKIIINYDNDLTGIIKSYELIDYLDYKVANIFFFPKSLGKDSDEVLVKVGEEQFKNLIKNL